MAGGWGGGEMFLQGLAMQIALPACASAWDMCVCFLRNISLSPEHIFFHPPPSLTNTPLRIFVQLYRELHNTEYGAC